MATSKQIAAAKRNVKKAQQGATAKKSLSHLPAKTKTALGNRAQPSRHGNGAAAGRRRPGPSCTRKRNVAISQAARRWGATNSPTHSATPERSD